LEFVPFESRKGKRLLKGLQQEQLELLGTPKPCLLAQILELAETVEEQENERR
jgi:hypothetical protein